MKISKISFGALIKEDKNIKNLKKVLACKADIKAANEAFRKIDDISNKQGVDVFLKVGKISKNTVPISICTDKKYKNPITQRIFSIYKEPEELSITRSKIKDSEINKYNFELLAENTDIALSKLAENGQNFFKEV